MIKRFSNFYINISFVKHIYVHELANKLKQNTENYLKYFEKKKKRNHCRNNDFTAENI